MTGSVDIAGGPRRADVGALTAILGVVTFLVVVIALHIVQAQYDPVNQLMSELALGPHGWAMLLAFAGVASALAGLQHSLGARGAGYALRGVLVLASISFLAAGIFPLGETSMLHIAAIAAAFVAAVLAMYLFPSLAGEASALMPRSLSWSFAAGVAASVALGHSVAPMGVGQRMAAACLLLWILVLGIRLCRARRG
jgi:hypothetical protein